MTTVRRLSGWKDARLCRLSRPLRWQEKIGSKTVRRSTSFVIESSCLGVTHYPANRFAQIIGDPVTLPVAA